MTINTKYKDCLYRFIFKEKDKLLSLYNALNNSNYEDINDLEVTTLEDVIYLSYKNDLSFLIYNDLFLVEHQSTVNPNMALRSFLYFARLYEGIVGKSENSIYGSTIFKIPTPKSFVLYNGNTEIPEITVLKLSDSFINEDKSNNYEWTTTVLNINKEYNQELLLKCRPLFEYMYFINLVKEYVNNGDSYEVAIDKAIEECIKNNIMSEMLKKHRAEVKSVCLTEFDQKKFEDTIRRESKAEGLAEGYDIGQTKGEEKNRKEMIQSMYKNGLSVEDISKFTDVDLETVKKCIRE